MSERTLKEHYAWALERALACKEDKACAASFVSDMSKHPEGKTYMDGMWGMMIFGMKGEELREFLKGFNF